MKKLVLCFLLYCVWGCETPPSSLSNTDGQQTILPKEVVGVWECRPQLRWKFKVEPDGTISKINHIICGIINVKEGGVSAEGPEPGTFAAFELSECSLTFDPKTKYMKITVIMDSFSMVFPGNLTLQGYSKDYFEGYLSDDLLTWNAVWTNESQVNDSIDPDPNNPLQEKLVFEKNTSGELKQVETGNPSG